MPFAEDIQYLIKAGWTRSEAFGTKAMTAGNGNPAVRIAELPLPLVAAFQSLSAVFYFPVEAGNTVRGIRSVSVRPATSRSSGIALTCGLLGKNIQSVRRPRKVADDLQAGSVCRGNAAETYRVSMAHILIIDDDDSVRDILKRFLERFGYIVSLASSGREGLRLLQQKKTDIVITDIFMPEMDGLEVILEIRKRCHRLSGSLPVIAISGGILTMSAKPISFLDQARAFGAARVFQKPLDFAGIQTAIQELLPAEQA